MAAGVQGVRTVDTNILITINDVNIVVHPRMAVVPIVLLENTVTAEMERNVSGVDLQV